MAHLRPDIYKAVKENDLDLVLFADPFTETSRKAKRNLLIASFTALLISVLKLEITGFLGLQASGLQLGNELAQGLACAVVIYFFMTFIFSAYIDYAAWQFQREKQSTKPYIDLIQMLENHIHVTAEQIKNAVDPLRSINLEPEIQTQIDVSQKVRSALDKLSSIDNRLNDIANETQPLLKSWKATMEKMERLNWRLRARFVGLWSLDIMFPVALSILAVVKTYQGLWLVFERVAI